MQRQYLLERFNPKKYFSVEKEVSISTGDHYYLVIFRKGRKLITDYFNNKYFSTESGDIKNYIKIKILEIADEIEIQFYINQFCKMDSNFEKNDLCRQFIRAAKVEFQKQGPCKYTRSRKGLYELANRYCQQLFNLKNQAPVEEKKLFSQENPIEVAQAALIQSRKQFPLGPDNIFPVIVNRHSGQIKFFSSLAVSHYSPQRRKLEAILDQKISDLARKRITDNREEMNSIIRYANNMSDDTAIRVKRTFFAKKSAKKGAGRCDELATSSFLYVVDNFPGKVELAEFTIEKIFKCPQNKTNAPTIFFQHVFVVVNRPDDSKKEDWKTWGSDTIILDPWINCTFRANQFAEVWRDNPWFFNPDTVEIHINLDDSKFRKRKSGCIMHPT